MKRITFLKRLFYTLLSLHFIILFSSADAIHPFNESKDTDSDSLYQSNEALKQVYLRIYQNPELAPSGTFNPGHVSPAEIRDYLQQEEYGYSIQLPGNTLVPSPCYYSGRIYLSGGFGSKRYYSFQARSGEYMKAWDLDDDGPSSAAIAEDILVFNTESCTVFAIDLKTGKQIWSWWLGDPLMCMPTIANGTVFTSYPATFPGRYSGVRDETPQEEVDVLSSLSHVLIAIDLKTGKILWQRWIDGDVMSAPVADGKDLYLTSFAGTLYKFNQEDGALLSVSRVKATSAPVITKEGVSISRRSDQEQGQVREELALMDRDMGKIKERYAEKTAIYLDKTVQGSSHLKTAASEMDAGNGFIGGAPAASGWSKAYDVIGQSNVSSLQSFQGSRTLIHDGKNYATRGDELVCTDPATGKELWSVKLQGDLASTGGFLGTPPLEVGGYIILATYAGDVLIMNARSGKVVQKHETGDPLRYQPIAMKGWIYVTTTNSRMHAINTGIKEITGWPMWGGNAERTNYSGTS